MPGVYSWVPGIQGAVSNKATRLNIQLVHKQGNRSWGWTEVESLYLEFLTGLVIRASYAFHNIEMKWCPAWYDSWTSGNKIINFCSSHARWIIQTPFFWSTKINLVILFPSFDNLAFNQWWRGWPSSRDVGSLYARLRNYWASHWTLCLNS